MSILGINNTTQTNSIDKLNRKNALCQPEMTIDAFLDRIATEMLDFFLYFR